MICALSRATPKPSFRLLNLGLQAFSRKCEELRNYWRETFAGPADPREYFHERGQQLFESFKAGRPGATMQQWFQHLQENRIGSTFSAVKSTCALMHGTKANVPKLATGLIEKPAVAGGRTLCNWWWTLFTFSIADQDAF